MLHWASYVDNLISYVDACKLKFCFVYVPGVQRVEVAVFTEPFQFRFLGSPHGWAEAFFFQKSHFWLFRAFLDVFITVLKKKLKKS